LAQEAIGLPLALFCHNSVLTVKTTKGAKVTIPIVLFVPLVVNVVKT
jgi:hypothetical protein